MSTCYEKNGWIYFSIKGKPYDRGLQYGKNAAKYMDTVFKTIRFICIEDYGREWDYFVGLSNKYLFKTVKTQFAEFYDEIRGFVDGSQKMGFETTIQEMVYNSVTNIGINPTFNMGNEINIETHLIDFNRDIYGEEMRVSFLKKIRDEKKFSSVNDLVSQINNDVFAAKEFFKS